MARFSHVGILLAAAIPLCASPANRELDLAFRNEVRPLLDTYCSRCHGPELRTAGIAFSDFADHASVVKSRSVWVRALRVLRENEMPPVDPQPTLEERQTLVDWIDDAVNNLDWTEFRDPGAVTIPRLNRTEYNNTIRDLTGLDLRPASAFPVDGQGESGFRNDRDGLFVAPLLAAKYLDAASQIVDVLIPDHGVCRQPERATRDRGFPADRNQSRLHGLRAGPPKLSADGLPLRLVPAIRPLPVPRARLGRVPD